MNLYERLFRTLNEMDVRYMVVGGVAVNLYGIERSTGDVDLLLDLGENNLRRFIDCVPALDLAPRTPVELEQLLDPAVRRNWIEEKGMLAFSMYDKVNPWFQVDILINEPVGFNAAFDKRETMEIDGSVVPLAPIEALITMKEGTGRPQDEADAVHLKRILAGWDDE